MYKYEKLKTTLNLLVVTGSCVILLGWVSWNGMNSCHVLAEPWPGATNI